MFIRYVSKEGGLVVSDALKLAYQAKKKTFVANFIQSPLVLLSLLFVSWGFHYLVKLLDPFFLPAPILTCLVLLLVLCLLSKLSPVEYTEEGERTTSRKFVDPVMRVIEKPCDLILKHMAVCFTPSFILIPSGTKIAGKEVGLLIAWFLTSFIAVFAITISLHRLMGLLPFFADKIKVVDIESDQPDGQPDEPKVRDFASSNPTPLPSSTASTSPYPSPHSKPISLPDSSTPQQPPPLSFSRLDVDTAAELEHNDRTRRKSSVTTMVNSVMDLKALGDDKEREKAARGDSIEMEETVEANSEEGGAWRSADKETESRSWVDEVDVGLRKAQSTNFDKTSRRSSISSSDDSHTPAQTSAPATDFRKSWDWDARTIRPTSPIGKHTTDPYIPPRTVLSRPSTPFPEADTTAADLRDIATRDLLVARLSASIDILMFLIITLIAVPVFYATKVSVPFFLALNILVYLLVIKNVSAKWKKYAHPILVTAFITFFLVWGFGASVGWSLQTSLKHYSTGAGYIQMWSINPPPEGRRPGAGDLLVDGLDAGIIALALPLYRHRADLKKYFFRMASVIIPSAVLSLFVWPLGALAFGLAPNVALAFVGRFSSTPLAVAQVSRLGGDGKLTVVLVVVTGIVVVIFERQIRWCCRVKEDDFLAVGLLFGVTSGAIGATGLHNCQQPRAAAIASLTFALFGTVLLIAIGIPPVAMYIKALIGG